MIQSAESLLPLPSQLPHKGQKLSCLDRAASPAALLWSMEKLWKETVSCRMAVLRAGNVHADG